jgi:hypothetical protein
MTEMCQLHEKGVWTAVHFDKLSSQQRSKVIRSMLFLKRKSDGRLKGRLLADGRMQERSASYDLSSPTVATDSLFMVAVIRTMSEEVSLLCRAGTIYGKAGTTGYFDSYQFSNYQSSKVSA